MKLKLKFNGEKLVTEILLIKPFTRTCMLLCPEHNDTMTNHILRHLIFVEKCNQHISVNKQYM